VILSEVLGLKWKRNMKNLSMYFTLIACSLGAPLLAQEPSFDTAFEQHCSDIDADARLENFKKQCQETYTRYKGDLLRSYYLETMTEKDTDIIYDSEIESFGHCPNQVIPDGVPGPGALLDSKSSIKQTTREKVTSEKTSITTTTIACEFIASCEPCLDKGDAVASSFIGLE
jgi:hypothetical protein